jgi:XTP/dITP diphosphohydrolase
MQEKAAGVGFDWNDKKQVWGKFNEELNELNQALNSNEKDAIEDEFGDVLFSLINYARFIKVNPESALERTNKKFLQRFQFIEVQAKKQDRSIEYLTLSEMESFWQEAKNQSPSDS